MCISLFLFIYVFGSLLSPTCGEWVSPASRLPYADDQMVVASYNDIIFILGGAMNPSPNFNQMIEYHMDTDTFVLLNETLSRPLIALAQSWGQLEETIYMMDQSGNYLNTFNMMTKQFTSSWQNIPYFQSDACLAVSNNLIFVTGGVIGSATDQLQVLNLTSSQWIGTVPAMQQVRKEHACVAHESYLWVFGGVFFFGEGLFVHYPVNNERISITNIASNQWEYIGNPLGLHRDDQGKEKHRRNHLNHRWHLLNSMKKKDPMMSCLFL
eukprot:1015126_1